MLQEPGASTVPKLLKEACSGRTHFHFALELLSDSSDCLHRRGTRCLPNFCRVDSNNPCFHEPVQISAAVKEALDMYFAECFVASGRVFRTERDLMKPSRWVPLHRRSKRTELKACQNSCATAPYATTLGVCNG